MGMCIALKSVHELSVSCTLTLFVNIGRGGYHMLWVTHVIS